MTDYSMSAHRGIAFRKPWMGWAGTGLVIGGLGVLWEEALEFARSHAGRSQDEAAEIEARIPPKMA